MTDPDEQRPAPGDEPDTPTGVRYVPLHETPTADYLASLESGIRHIRHDDPNPHGMAQ